MPPRFPPFTPAEKTSIFIGLTFAVLLAIWSFVRAFRERTPVRRSGWLGAAIFILLFIIEAAAAVRESPFFTENTQRLLVLPITGIAIIACLFVVLRFGSGRNVRTVPVPLLREETAESRQFLVLGAVIYATALAALLPGMLLSLYGQLFGQQGFWIFGIAGFLLAMAVFFLAGHRLGIRFRRTYPSGLSGKYTRLRGFKAPMHRAMISTAFCAAIGLVVLAGAARLDGVPGTPVFAPREHYYLSNHNATTEVSRLRYCLAGVGFDVGWHSGASCALLLALHALFFGYLPKNFGTCGVSSVEAGEVKRDSDGL